MLITLNNSFKFSEPRSPFSGSAMQQQQQAKPAEVKPKDKMEDELAGFLAVSWDLSSWF